MAWPSLIARTKNWGTETLTDADLEGQLDLIITYINDMMDSTNGHKHDATTAEGPKILVSNLNLTSSAAGDILYHNGTNLTRLGIGSSNEILRVLAGVPDWQVYTSLFLTPTEYTDVTDTNNADETFSSGTYADSALSITFTVGKAGLVHASFSGVSNGAAGDSGFYALVVDGTVVQEVSTDSAGGTQNFPISLSYTGVLTAASHTIKIQVKRGGSGTETLLGSVVTSRLRVSHPS